MKKINGILLSLPLAFLLGCEYKDTTPDYPVIPYIELRDFKFIKQTNSSADTVKLKFYLHDGDFDLGVSGSEFSPPFNPFFVLNKTTGQLIPVEGDITDLSNLVTYASRNLIDTLPPLSCSHWFFTSTPNADTIYFQGNPNTYNVLADLYIQNESTQAWQVVDPSTIFNFNDNCITNLFNGRFSPLPTSGGYKYGPFSYTAISSKEGTMTYSVANYYFGLLFHNKKVKLRFYIQDHALHHSNVIETNEIVIE